MTRHREIQAGPLLAAAGAVLLLVSLFLDWFDVFSAWTIFELIDLLLAGLALATIAAALSTFGLPRWVPVRALPALGALAFVVVTSQLLNHPPAGVDRDIELGAWLGFVASTAMLLGGIVSVTRVSFAIDVSGRAHEGSAPPHEPPPAPAPSAGAEPPPPAAPRPDGDETQRLP